VGLLARNRPANDVVTTVQPSLIVGHGTREMV
jgi:hypothetical protein